MAPPKNYDAEDLELAKNDIIAGLMSISAAGRHYSIPSSTLGDHMKRRLEEDPEARKAYEKGRKVIQGGRSIKNSVKIKRLKKHAGPPQSCSKPRYELSHSKHYSQDTLKQAIKAIWQGMKIKDAVQNFGIPPSTLRVNSQRFPDKKSLLDGEMYTNSMKKSSLCEKKAVAPSSRGNGEMYTTKKSSLGVKKAVAPSSRGNKLSLKNKPAAAQKLLYSDSHTESSTAPNVGDEHSTEDTDENADGDTEDAPCVAALHNLGNTCFLNSVLQVLRFTPNFVEQINSLAKEVKISIYEKTLLAGLEAGEEAEEVLSWELVQHLHALFNKMAHTEEKYGLGSSNYIALRPYDLLDTIERLNPLFQGNMQQDAHELLRCLLAYIQDATKEVNKFRETSSQTPVGSPKKAVAPELDSSLSDAQDSTVELEDSFTAGHQSPEAVRKLKTIPSPKTGSPLSKKLLSPASNKENECVDKQSLRHRLSLVKSLKPVAKVEAELPTEVAEVNCETLKEELDCEVLTLGESDSEVPSVVYAGKACDDSLTEREDGNDTTPEVKNVGRCARRSSSFNRSTESLDNEVVFRKRGRPCKKSTSGEVKARRTQSEGGVVNVISNYMKVSEVDREGAGDAERKSSELEDYLSMKEQLDGCVDIGPEAGGEDQKTPMRRSSRKRKLRGSKENIDSSLEVEAKSEVGKVRKKAKTSETESTPVCDTVDNKVSANPAAASKTKNQPSILSMFNHQVTEQVCHKRLGMAMRLVTSPTCNNSTPVQTNGDSVQTDVETSPEDIFFKHESGNLDGTLDCENSNDTDKVTDDEIVSSKCTFNKNGNSQVSVKTESSSPVKLRQEDPEITASVKVFNTLSRTQTARKTFGAKLTIGNCLVNNDSDLKDGSDDEESSSSSSEEEEEEEECEKTHMTDKEAVVRLEKYDVTRFFGTKIKPHSSADIHRRTEKIKDCVENLFQGTVELRTRCGICERHTERKEDYQDISIPLKREAPPSMDGEDNGEEEEEEEEEDQSGFQWIKEALEEVEPLNGENKYYCEPCLRLVEAERSMHYVTVPCVLTLHLKRFALSGLMGGFTKLTEHRNTPFTIPSIQDKASRTPRYELYAVITHVGFTLSSGHYIAYVRAPRDHIGVQMYRQQQLIEREEDQPQQTVTPPAEHTSAGDDGCADPNNNADDNNNLGDEENEVTFCPKRAGDNAEVNDKSVLDDSASLWLECDDELITVLTEEEFCAKLEPGGSTCPYLLFYREAVSL